MKGLKGLIQLPQDKVITIKPCDKGSGVMILDFEAYNNLNQKQKDNSNYYEKVNQSKMGEIKNDALKLLEEGLENEYISKQELKAMDPNQKGPGKFHHLFNPIPYGGWGVFFTPSKPISLIMVFFCIKTMLFY